MTRRPINNYPGPGDYEYTAPTNHPNDPRNDDDGCPECGEEIVQIRDRLVCNSCGWFETLT